MSRAQPNDVVSCDRGRLSPVQLAWRRPWSVFVFGLLLTSAPAWAQEEAAGVTSTPSDGASAAEVGLPADPTAPTSATAPPIEVTVRGKAEPQRLRESALAVQVVETTRAKRESADLGEVLARSQGIGLRRAGGLGSEGRLSLNGLTDDQVRFFLDGIPLEWAGYPFGMANVPVNLVEHVEVYRGVVPVHFGADALGGAVNLQTERDVRGTHGGVSYQLGSFGTQRITANARHLHRPSGFFARASGFYDYADNDYPVTAEVADPNAGFQNRPTRVYRFHDAYRAVGSNVELGLVGQPWAKRLLVRGFFTDYRKDLQHNLVMTAPYGEVTAGARTAGATLRYEKRFLERLTVDAVAGYAYSATDFRDVSNCIYNWFGQCWRQQPQGIFGELEPQPTDQTLWDHRVFGRFNFGWKFHPQHRLRVSIAPNLTTRTGDERRREDPDERDPLSAQRDLYTLVGGLEYEVDLLDDRLENIVFVKGYLQRVRSEEQVRADVFREENRDTDRYGYGDMLRYRFYDWLYAKASYEWATRLPRTDEIFGDGVLVFDNLALEPEVSHNANLELVLDLQSTPVGSVRASVNGFLRESDKLIALLGIGKTFYYQNVLAARSAGVEVALGWTSPGEYLALDGNVTHLEFRNRSGEGAFGDYKGDRIPNRPYLFANASARLQLRRVAAAEDTLSLAWYTRYTGEFFRGWESAGRQDSKDTIDAQLLHTLAFTYFVDGDPLAVSFTGEIANVTDQAAFDFFGVQRPGRAFFFKTTAEL